MTLDVYGHLFPHGDDAAELAQATAALLGPTPTGNVVPLTKRTRKAIQISPEMPSELKGGCNAQW